MKEQPSLIGRLSTTQSSAGFEEFLEDHVDNYWFYGYGKGALRDGLAPFVSPGETAFLPAYIPDAVAKPFEELGLDTMYYAVTENLAPDVTDLESRIGEDTGVVVSVDYFGFPTPGWSAVADLTTEYDCLHLDNCSHSPFSIVDGTLLGTRGDIGFTSMRKVLPMPDGACLYVDETLAGEIVPSEYAGKNERLNAADISFLGRSAATEILGPTGTIQSTIADLAVENASNYAGPSERYEASKAPMSRVSSAILSRIDPARIRGARRANYAAWDAGLAARPDVRPVRDEVTPGVCPQVYPVKATVPERFLADLRTYDVDAATWPRLPRAVKAVSDYRNARRLADQVITLPVHQQIDRSEIATICRELTT